MTEPTKEAVPPGWGRDELTKFLDNVRANQLGTFANMSGWFARLAEIDRAFTEILQESRNPRTELMAMLFLRCHSAFRAASGLALAGHAVESYPVNRTALEFAGYALHMFRNPALQKIWLDRGQSASATDESRRAFSHNKVRASINAANRHAGERFEALYQHTIDFGAHPNELSVTGHMAIVEANGVRQWRSIYLHDGDVPHAAALKTTATCGVVSLELMQCVYSARFELLGVNAELPRLKAGL
jgi:hypothetical protein